MVDASEARNHGTAVKAELVAGRDGKKARRFEGQGHIAVPKSSSLDPGVRSWTVEVTCKPERDRGIVLAHGGQTNGYALSLDAGRPVFTVVIQNRPTRIVGRSSIVGQWAKLTGQILPDETCQLLVDGQKVAAGRLPGPMRTPLDTLQIGADLGSQVLGDDAPAAFVGLIESARIYSGVAP